MPECASEPPPTLPQVLSSPLRATLPVAHDKSIQAGVCTPTVYTLNDKSPRTWAAHAPAPGIWRVPVRCAPAWPSPPDLEPTPQFLEPHTTTTANTYAAHAPAQGTLRVPVRCAPACRQ